jgi:prepilin-type N-terminal cleavage/methylation domain-containing protein
VVSPHRLNARGFSLTELIVVVGVLALMMAVSVPFFLNYWQTSTLRAGAEELVTVLNGARQLAIKENQTVCVTTAASAVTYHVTNCGTPGWVGPDTDANGLIRLQNGVQVTAAPNVTFTYLGAAGAGGTYTVVNPASGLALCVVVSPSGRISIAAPAAQPVCP